MVGLSALDRKLVRDLLRMWAQVIAISLVMACGVATIIIAMGSYRSLQETRAVFYERYLFADLFARANRAPETLGRQIATLPGVSAVETRIVKLVLLDMIGMKEPGTAIAVSIPENHMPSVNRLYIRSGRLPIAERPDEVAVIEGFAKAHKLEPGSTFSAIINGTKRTLRVAGIVLTPEYVYSIGPGDMVPDQRRFGVLFFPQSVMAGLFDMDGAFNNVAIRTTRGANLGDIETAVDQLLAPYGGSGTHDRTTQLSHSFLDNELVQLRAMASIIPPIFLFVSAFLVNMTLMRLITLEREQIGLMKALGYSNMAIGWHYAKLTIVIALLGSVIGAAAGLWAGQQMTRLYARFFAFPFLIFIQSIDLHVIAISASVAAALIGSVRAILSVVALPAAIAMQPAAPLRYHRLLGGRALSVLNLSQTSVMILRSLFRQPLRTLLTTLGTALSVALLVTALFSTDSIHAMIDTIFFRAERANATLIFTQPRNLSAIEDVAHLPGVMRTEPFRMVPVILKVAQRQKSLVIQSVAMENDLSQMLDENGVKVEPPASGLMLSHRLANYLHVSIGDPVDVELIEQGNRHVLVPVTSLIETFVGLTAAMRVDALARLTGEGKIYSGARIAEDMGRIDDLYQAIKSTPAITGVVLQKLSRDHFIATMGENIGIFTSVYATLAIIITFGVVYNSARIQMSEQARELASLRVLGFTRSEVSFVLLGEIAVIVIAAQPLGWVLGMAFSALMVKGFESDLFRVPLVIEVQTFAISSLIVLSAAVISALVVRRRIDNFDLIAVLKTRD